MARRAEAQPTPVGELRQPKGLNKIEAAEFRRIRSALRAAGFLAIDEAILRVYLDAYARWKEAADLVKVAGSMITTTPNGSLQIHPANTIVRQQAELLKKLCQELGFSPGARRRLKMDVAQDPDDDDLT